MSTYLYQAEALRQLHNTKYYNPIPHPTYPKTSLKITHILDQLLHHRYINPKQHKYLKPDPSNINSRYFYLLPKVHKNRSSWPHPHCPPGRPIVSDVNTESSRICEYIDFYLQPLSILHPSYIKDTYHFVNKIRNTPIHPDHLLITADVESLYTNMQLDLIIESIREIFLEHPDPSRPDQAILDLLSLTLYNNDFEFNNQFFLQICGIAMGRRYAPASANIYLRKFDHSAQHDFHIHPLLYSRFLDDIFGVWPGTQSQLMEYQNFLNSLIPGIKVTFTVHHHIINFLDTYVYKHTDPSGTCTLQTKVYFKPTDTHQLLHRTSFHPSHTFNSIIKSQFIRFKRISSTFLDYQEASSTLIRTLRKRGYSLPKLLKYKRHTWHNYTNSPDNITHKQHNEIIPVITFFDKHHSTLNQQWTRAIRINPIFKNQDIRILAAYKKHKNLRNILVSSRFTTEHTSSTPNQPTGSKRCPNTRCKACNFIVESNSFRSTHNQRTFSLKQAFTCKSCNLIYLITCRKCHKQYIGETGRTLAQRITDHTSYIRLKKPTPTGLHFNLPDHNISHFSILPIEQIFDNSSDSYITRRNLERKWQQLLHTAHPLGFNNLHTPHTYPDSDDSDHAEALLSALVDLL